MEEKYKAAVITVSDRAYNGVYEDKSGPALCRLLEENSYEISAVRTVPDDVEMIEKALVDFSDAGIHLILTTGGTGFALRDVTPEATKAVITRDVPGLAEYMRISSAAITEKALLSRAVCGIRNNSLIINLPGSPKGACENLMSVIAAVKHGLDILAGKGECPEI